MILYLEEKGHRSSLGPEQEAHAGGPIGAALSAVYFGSGWMRSRKRRKRKRKDVDQ